MAPFGPDLDSVVESMRKPIRASDRLELATTHARNRCVRHHYGATEIVVLEVPDGVIVEHMSSRQADPETGDVQPVRIPCSAAFLDTVLRWIPRISAARPTCPSASSRTRAMWMASTSDSVMSARYPTNESPFGAE